MKQTSIEWLFAHLIPHLDWSKVEDRELFRKLKAEAQQMHKEEIIDASVQATPRNIPKYNAITKEIAERFYQECLYVGNNHIADANKMVCEHLYSRSMNQPYPRKCTKCGEKEDKQ